MAVQLKLIDRFKLKDRLSTNYACSYSEDDRLFILCDTGIYIISLKGSPSCPFPILSCKKDFFKVSDFMPSANVDLDVNSFHTHLNRTVLYEIAMSTEYSTNLENTTRTEPLPLTAQWSPKGIVGKTDCMLAVLTNLFSLELYVKYLDKNKLVNYCMVCNVSQEIINIERTKWGDTVALPANLKLNELKRRIEIVMPRAFAWSHIFTVNNQEICTLFVGHINGDITLWKINVRPANSKDMSKIILLCRYSTNLTKITTMYWHRTTEFGGGLCFADSRGRMSVVHISKLNEDETFIDNELAFWAEADDMLVDKITVITYNNTTYILVIKQSYLVIYGINEAGNVFDQKVCNVGHYYITGLYHFDNVILVLTMPGVLKQYTLSVENSKIVLKEVTILLKMDVSRFRTHGFFFSNNRVLFGLIVFPCYLRCFNKVRTHINVFLYRDALLKPLEILWHNKTGSLRNYWDCLEALRLISLKNKQFPWVGLPPNLNYDHLSLYHLKMLRWVAKISEMVFNIVPTIKSYDIKPYIILHYLVNIKLIVRRINELLNLMNSGIHLSAFQMRSIDIQNFFLKEMVVKNILAKANVGKNFVDEIWHVMSVANELRYPPMVQCTWCGEKLVGPLCVPPHADSRCSVSMMPIYLVPAYKCPFCMVLVHKEIEREQDVIFCPYCDVPMEVSVVDENFSKDYKLDCEEVKSVCFDDCLKDDIDFSEIEENTSDYVIFSDSDEELDEEGKLRTLYVQMANMSLEEILKCESEGGRGEESEKDDVEAGPSHKVPKLESESL